MEKYIGTARNVRELQELLSKVDSSATLTVCATMESWSFLEVWYNKEINDVEIR